MIESLGNPLDENIVFSGKRIKLRLAFDRVLRVYDLWGDDLFDSAEKVNLSLEILTDSRRTVQRFSLETRAELLEQIFNGYINAQTRSTVKEKVFDFKQDAGFIYASFYMDYGMDLLEQQGKLHWRKFIALFQGLSERTIMREIMSIRSRPIPKPTKYNAEEISRLREAKVTYALKGKSDGNFQDEIDAFVSTLERMAVS